MVVVVAVIYDYYLDIKEASWVMRVFLDGSCGGVYP